jgi:flagellin
VVVNATAGTAGTVTAVADGTDLEDLKALNGTITVGSKSLDLASVDYTGVTTAAGALAALTAAVEKAFGTGVTVALAGTTGITFTGATPAATATAAEVASASPTFSQKSGAIEAIDKIDAAITDVSKVRSQLGAVQNRFDHTINNLNVAVENLTSSESRIRDTDMASEMVSFTRAQILSQAGTAMLAQAKSIPQSVLQLLQ